MFVDLNINLVQNYLIFIGKQILMSSSEKLEIIFAETASGKKPVEQWILNMTLTERKKVTAEIEKASMFYQIGGGGNIKKISGKKTYGELDLG